MEVSVSDNLDPDESRRQDCLSRTPTVSPTAGRNRQKCGPIAGATFHKRQKW
jgi:hypothetical protein